MCDVRPSKWSFVSALQDSYKSMEHESEREDQKKTGGKISLVAYGGHYGRKGMGDVLKERLAAQRRSR
ncbi:hypothetical protein H5410_060331 [Solanum commersonii]|uniref:Uncharacterized protein n=1 Tax=Solanum commersonii TaxID=4109 RepID=A0A9J5W4T8_SOLCO|nr:hypothetical protein H5410_060331 [Solanum commersonii]